MDERYTTTPDGVDYTAPDDKAYEYAVAVQDTYRGAWVVRDDAWFEHEEDAAIQLDEWDCSFWGVALLAVYVPGEEEGK